MQGGVHSINRACFDLTGAGERRLFASRANAGSAGEAGFATSMS